MAALTEQEKNQQNRGWIKIGDGTYAVDITDDGEFKVRLPSETTEQDLTFTNVRDKDISNKLDTMITLLGLISLKLTALEPFGGTLGDTDFKTL